MQVCTFNLSKYEVSLFRLHTYIAFLTITASSYDKNNDYDNVRDI